MSDLKKEILSIIGADAENIVKALADAGFVIVPKVATDGLLCSMAMRWDHSFGMPQKEFLPGFEMGYTSEMRQSLMVSMSQLHSEVVGEGFYHPDREDGYVAIIEGGGIP